MSDFEDDIDNQLLELAGATEKKKRRQPSNSNGTNTISGSGGGNKKRKAERMEIESEKEPIESEDEGEDLYPLEGKYKDEADRRELLAMTEFSREQILEERSEQKQHLQNLRAVDDMVKQQLGGGGVAPGDDSVSRAAKRHHTARGATKEKTQRLDELKAKRKAKDDKKRSKAHNSPLRPDRSASPQDMDISESESEDGQISKLEQEEERFFNLTSGVDPRGKGRAGKDKEGNLDVPCSMADLETCRLTREDIVRHYVKPWFQDFVTGAWVRYLIGQEDGSPVYRICQINNLASDLVKPYKVNDQTMNQSFELRHGKSLKVFTMDKVSNGPFLEKEFERLTKTFSNEDVKLPTKRTAENKVAQMQKLVTQPMTESDITAMLARKSQLQISSKPTAMSAMERSRLTQARTVAQRRNDWNEVAEIDAKLAEAARTSQQEQPPRADNVQDLLAKVNERNRKANMEAVRKAEMAEAERKKKERKLLAQNGGRATVVDPSARLKTLPRIFNSNTPVTRPGTPVAAATAAPTPLAPARKNSSFEASLIESVEIDLGDF